MNKSLSALILLAATMTGHASDDWDYDEHGDDWNLGVCQSGSSQSPIDIDTTTVFPGEYLANMNYRSRTAEAVNNGHTVQFNPDNRHIEIVDNVTGTLQKFTLIQFHLHNGSEHTIDGVRHDMEAHFVHANDAYLEGDEVDGRLAVIGVFLNAVDTDDRSDKKSMNKAWNKILKNLPNYNNDNNSVSKIVKADYYNLLPQNDQVYTYEGSLTTPNCDEIVNWIVMKQPVTISPKSVANFAASQNNHKTYRNIQPTNGRAIKLGDMTGTRK